MKLTCQAQWQRLGKLPAGPFDDHILLDENHAVPKVKRNEKHWLSTTSHDE